MRRELRIDAVRWLSIVFLLGGMGRVLSLVIDGWPQWLQTGLTVIELAVPLMFLWLARGVRATQPGLVAETDSARPLA